MQFDFQAYIRERKGGGSARPESAPGYAFGRDRRVMRTLRLAKPVRLVIDTGMRFARTRFEGLEGQTVVADRVSHPRLMAALRDAAGRLGSRSPARVLVGAVEGLGATAALAFKSEEIIIVHPSVLDLDDEGLAFQLGRAAGHLQQGHAVYLNALWLLDREPGQVTNWVVGPATAALTSWARLGDVTADRAGLIACGNVDVAVRELLSMAGIDASEGQTGDEPMSGLNAYLTGRIQALRIFGESEVFRRGAGMDGGDSLSSVDSRVEEVIHLV
jgi:hypothetical protein